MGNLKKALRIASVGLALSAPMQGQAQEQESVPLSNQAQTTQTEHRTPRDFVLPDGRALTHDEFLQMAHEMDAEQHQERFNTAEGNEWVTRVPVGNGWRTEPVTSLDEALKNPTLKDHIYIAGTGGYQTPLGYGVINNDMGLIEKCLAAGVNPDIGRIGTGAGPDSPLAKAINNYSRFKREGRDVSVQAREIEALLKAGANPNITTAREVVSDKPGQWYEGEGNTPLHKMAELRDNKMINLLISHGADVSEKRNGKTPLDVYQSDYTELDGSPLQGRDPANPDTIAKLTPKETGFSLFGFLSRNGGR